MGRRIRIWKPGASYHVTLQCIDRMFLLKPSDEAKHVRIEIEPLPGWEKLSESERQKKFRQIIRDNEAEAENERRAEGIVKVKGMSKIKQESPFGKPKRLRNRPPEPL